MCYLTFKVLMHSKYHKYYRIYLEYQQEAELRCLGLVMAEKEAEDRFCK